MSGRFEAKVAITCDARLDKNMYASNVRHE